MFIAEAEALDGRQDIVSGFDPLERSGVFVVRFDDGADDSLALTGRAVDAALQLLAGQLGEPALDPD